MDNILVWFKWVAGGTSVLLTYVFGGFDIMLNTLFAFIVIDYISGVLSAIYKKELSSEIGLKGIAKKVGILLIIAVAHLIGQALGAEWLRDGVIGFYIANEAISILENVGKMDIPHSEKLVAFLKQLQGRDKGDDES